MVPGMNVSWEDVRHLAEVHLVPFAVRLLIALTVFLIALIALFSAGYHAGDIRR